MGKVRLPAVAGMFYPAQPQRLRQTVDTLLADASPEGAPPKALIVPHAGYVYSGAVAAAAYAQLRPIAARLRRVVLLGPAHFVPVHGLALPHVEAFATPLGEVMLDTDAMNGLEALPQVCRSDPAHAQEHSLEVQLPFLQVVLPETRLLPLLVGAASAEQVAEVINALWDGHETLILISSDLSHYHPYDSAVALDARTAAAIEALDPGPLDYESACGCRAIQGLLLCALRHGLSAHRLMQCNSGDTAGDRARVVGYGAWAFSRADRAAAAA